MYDMSDRVTSIADLLCCSLEGGSSYWASFNLFPAYRNSITESDRSNKDYHYCGEFSSYYALMHPNYCITVIDVEEAKSYQVDFADIVMGLETMKQDYSNHYYDFVNENADATTGDVFLQCVVFSKVIYG